MAKNMISGLAPKKLARLLGIAFDSEEESKPYSTEKVAQMLEACLASPLPSDTMLLQCIPLQAGQRSEEMEQYSGPPLGDVLTASDSDFTTIKKIRCCTKKMTRGKDLQVEHVALTIYFAAIANALVFHNTKITSYSYDSLGLSFDKLMEKTWIPQRLRQMFSDAARVCRNKSQEMGA